MIDWKTMKTSKQDMVMIMEIAERATAIGIDRSKLDLVMDLEAAHHACPLDLHALQHANVANFMHDVCGIGVHLNRETGELEDCFLPRYAQR